MYRETRLIEVVLKYHKTGINPDASTARHLYTDRSDHTQARDMFGAFSLDSSTIEKGNMCNVFWTKVRKSCEV